jgi:hypothetical protein
MPVFSLEYFVAAGFRLWPISASKAVGRYCPVAPVDSSHPVPRTTFSTDPRMAVQ